VSGVCRVAAHNFKGQHIKLIDAIVAQSITKHHIVTEGDVQ